MSYKCAIFDLDGVLVDTAKYHYLAWKELAGKLGFEFTIEHNEMLKGVSRMTSLDILLEVGNMKDAFSEEEKVKMATEKNNQYVEYISNIDESEILEGALSLLQELKQKGIKIALGSASKNAQIILKNVGLESYFDVIVDGNSVSKAKPDPEVFTLGAKTLGVPYEECVVFEDSQAGLEAAKIVGMLAVGVGQKKDLTNADVVYSTLKDFNIEKYF
ncbi:beta-phosphoglucomutase [Lederbergia wuyishanensis]|uniref:Beta-phosphoglucomutase n=1 Tax=Lederbergia wuyishanensis TaxID=1347903 RepID=A0ABU0D6I2_9BACI|nr:beta-phosphoglucomutase [Lederbergia wuyishanensis]MCJ8008581.1 beta-phosphoglucomutase [Lederbergia wuyishanensis]MDQ0344004.1 beta-phosphoglucomutase [Lederbergia wuyishanensis]